MTSELLHEAIALIRASKMDEARQIIFDIIRNEPQNEVAWIWLAETFSSDLDRLKVLNACSQNIPDSKIVNMAISKLKKKIDHTVDLSQSVNPFVEGGTFDPSARERTGHTGAIIGFDGSFIATEIPDFDEVVDLRAPKTSVLKRSDIIITKPVKSPDEFVKRAKTAPLNQEELEEPKPEPFEINPSIFVEPKAHQTGELNFEPDLSSFLTEETPGKEKANKLPPATEPAPLELPKVMQYNNPPFVEKGQKPVSASIFQPIKSVEVEEPISPFVPEPTVESLRPADLPEDSFLKQTYGEDEALPRKGVRRNVLLVSGVFGVIILLCAVTTLVMSGYTFGAGRPTPTVAAVFINEIVPTVAKLTLPPIQSDTPVASFTPENTATATGTPLATGTPTPSGTPTETPLFSQTPTRTRTRTQTPTASATSRFTSTRTLTATITPTPTLTYTASPTNTVPPTATPTITPTWTITNTPTRTLYPTMTHTPIPPTDTPIPPTYTPEPTNTPE